MIERALCLHAELLHDDRVWRRILLSLAELMSAYDCTARLRWDRKNVEMQQPWLEGARVRDFSGRTLVLLPNTEYLTLPQFLNPRRRNRNAPLVNGNHNYQLIMNHDYA